MGRVSDAGRLPHAQPLTPLLPLQVYNERAVDLLSTSARNKLEHHLDGLTWHALDSADAAQSLAEAAAARRATADNGLNAVSSRSHLVFLYRASTTCGVDAVKSGQADGQLALVDLAGSERLKRTEAVGERREEAVQINKSLSAIGDVVAALAKGTQHVPYRNAKLTHILQPYLERGCRVAMLVMASPAVADAAETANALTFGVRARSVTLGQARDAAGGTATARAHEVTRLKRLLLESRQAAVAHERAADEERAKLAAAEEKMEKAAEAAKAAEARAKAAEAGVSKEDAAAAKEKAALQKEVGELKRKLAAALARRRPTPTKHATPTSAAGAAGAPPRRAPRPTSARSARRRRCRRRRRRRWRSPRAAAAGARRRAAGGGVGRRGGGGGGGAAVVDEEAKGLAQQQAELPRRSRRRLWRRHGRRERAHDCGGGRRRDGGAAAAARPQLGDAADAVAAQDDAAQAELLRHPRRHPRLDRRDAAARRRRGGGPHVVVVALRRQGGARPSVGGAHAGQPAGDGAGELVKGLSASRGASSRRRRRRPRRRRAA